MNKIYYRRLFINKKTQLVIQCLFILILPFILTGGDKLETKTAPIEMEAGKQYLFKGFIGKFPVTMGLYLDGESGEISGSYSYDKYKVSITLEGETKNNLIELRERKDTISGAINSHGSFIGQWKSKDNQKVYPIMLEKMVVDKNACNENSPLFEQIFDKNGNFIPCNGYEAIGFWDIKYNPNADFKIAVIFHDRKKEIEESEESPPGKYVYYCQMRKKGDKYGDFAFFEENLHYNGWGLTSFEKYKDKSFSMTHNSLSGKHTSEIEMFFNYDKKGDALYLNKANETSADEILYDEDGNFGPFLNKYLYEYNFPTRKFKFGTFSSVSDIIYNSEDRNEYLRKKN